MKSTEEISPRIYGPASSAKKESRIDEELLGKFLRTEIILGGGIMAVGGFSLRVTDSYNLVVLGSLLVLAGLIRLGLTNFSFDEDKSAFPGDRLVFRLSSELSANYFLIKNLELPDAAPVELIACGPGGIYVFKKLDLSGRLDGEPDDNRWNYEPRGGEDRRKIPNPINVAAEWSSRVREHLSDQDVNTTELKFHNLVVLMKHQVEGSALKLSEVLRLGEAPDFVRRSETGELSWETINEIENTLKRRTHRIK